MKKILLSLITILMPLALLAQEAGDNFTIKTTDGKLLNGALPVEIRMEIYPSSNIMETNWSYTPKAMRTQTPGRHTISIK